ncbi:MAG TPA: CoA transferase, partial [Rubrobacter sp.]|nr:CoA transferase [Rubrobacter sp.]
MTDALEDALPGVLQGTKLVTLAQNVPGPAAASRLQDLGASVIKIEPPNGDPLASANPAWYGTLVAGQKVVQLDLKDAPDRARLDEYLAEADVLLT